MSFVNYNIYWILAYSFKIKIFRMEQAYRHTDKHTFNQLKLSISNDNFRKLK